jgi:large subunit ribosomal protein L3
MKGLIGKKLGMTQVYNDKGQRVSVTAVQAGPCTVTQLKTQEKDGYSAVQLGFGKRSLRKTTKPILGHVKKAGLDNTPPQRLGEIRLDSDPEYAVGDVLKADIFSVGEFIDVSGRTKGKGFQGVVKRHNFGGGRAGHGGGWTRKPGSIGMCVNPGRVYKGRKMPGQTGGGKRTVQNLEIIDVRPEDSILLVKGAIPGPTGSIVTVRSAIMKQFAE